MYVHVKPHQLCPICGRRTTLSVRNQPKKYCRKSCRVEGNRRINRARHANRTAQERADDAYVGAVKRNARTR